jgi:hypothetical protein
MIFAIVTLIIALMIAGIAAWFSIVGLMSIFTGAAISVAIMAGALEAGKLVAASWLYRYWKTSPLFLRLYLILAVIALMVITSMGIFGYLSKAHIEHTAGLGISQLEIESIDREIERAERSRETAEAEISRLDSAVAEMISRGFATRGLETRQSQLDERTALAQIVESAELTISEAQRRQTEFQREIQTLEREVGPILYLAQVIYGEDDRDTLEKTVRLLVIVLVLVFDPLAIALLLGANFALIRHGIHLERQDHEQTQEENKESISRQDEETATAVELRLVDAPEDSDAREDAERQKFEETDGKDEEANYDESNPSQEEIERDSALPIALTPGSEIHSDIKDEPETNHTLPSSDQPMTGETRNNGCVGKRHDA